MGTCRTIHSFIASETSLVKFGIKLGFLVKFEEKSNFLENVGRIYSHVVLENFQSKRYLDAVKIILKFFEATGRFVKTFFIRNCEISEEFLVQIFNLIPNVKFISIINKFYELKFDGSLRTISSKLVNLKKIEIILHKNENSPEILTKIVQYSTEICELVLHSNYEILENKPNLKILKMKGNGITPFNVNLSKIHFQLSNLTIEINATNQEFSKNSFLNFSNFIKTQKNIKNFKFIVKKYWKLEKVISRQNRLVPENSYNFVNDFNEILLHILGLKSLESYEISAHRGCEIFPVLRTKPLIWKST